MMADNTTTVVRFPPPAVATDHNSPMPPRQRDPEASRAFGHALRFERVRRRVTQAQVARTSGLTVATVSRIERGLREPTLSVVFRLAEAVGVSPEVLVRAAHDELHHLSPKTKKAPGP